MYNSNYIAGLFLAKETPTRYNLVFSFRRFEMATGYPDVLLFEAV